MNVSDISSNDHKSIQVLLADDNKDDRFFFKNVLDGIPISTNLTTVVDGERLMNYLYNNTEKLPDVLFLDLNMPNRNGSECLKEIKLNKILQHIPVIIYSTSLHDLVADQLYKNGAHYNIRKTNMPELRTALQCVLTMMVDKKFERPPINKFVLC